MATPVAPTADLVTFGVIILKATLGLGESNVCPYNVASVLILWILREVLPDIPGDPKREGGSLGYVGGDGGLDPCAAADDTEADFDDSSRCGLLGLPTSRGGERNGGYASTDFGNVILC